MRHATLLAIAAALALTGGCGKKDTPPAAPTAPPSAPGAVQQAPADDTEDGLVEKDTASAAALVAVRHGALVAAQPETTRIPVLEAYHGVEVTEDYRWLEDGAAAPVKAWTEAQNAHARALLDALPHHAEVRAAVATVFGAEVVSWSHVTTSGGRWFAMKRQPPKQQPFLVVADDLGQVDAARVLVDPGAADAAGTTAIDWFVPSPDGTKVAVSLSKGGTESGDVHVFDAATGAEVGDVVPRVNGGTAGGALAWNRDGSGFWYSRYPRGDERPDEDKDFWVQIYYHALGAATSADSYELGKGMPRIAEYDLATDERSGRVLATVQDGDGGQFAHFLRETDGKWRQFSTFDDKTVTASFGPDDTLFVMSREDAPRGKVLRVPIDTLQVATAPVVVAEGEDAIVEDFWGPPTVLATASRLYVVYQRGGPSVIRAFTLDGAPAAGPEQPPVSSAGGLIPLGGDDVAFWSRSFVTPTTWNTFAAADGTTTPTAFASGASADLGDVEVVRELATSKDGTLVPVNILVPRGTPKDGTAACVVYGYGGYGVNIEPTFASRYRPLFDQGVVVAITNLRGGGEFGEAWHRGGNLANKQNVFDDFAAAIAHLAAERYVAADRVGILGGSNGGLLMGATLVQHPTVPAAVVSFVGIYDMLRVELSANGAFNVPEFGTVADPALFTAMYAYSPYHNVKDGVAYPPTLFLTGENDPRVDPLQSRKMTARLQRAVADSPAPRTPILLRTSADAGHGGDTKLDERVAQYADAYAFLFDQLGVAWRAPTGASE
ncbi:MAG: S9 family peptidase [Deltaproteobacteria bacterium HGW-Deltaproteobacteria-14]|jgi:prolyl oligopeptidase|nr:MAG: S9 family peptidase [Deltaproteobacteria bacterium HGW-Deltaproteobacteria-14]